MECPVSEARIQAGGKTGISFTDSVIEPLNNAVCQTPWTDELIAVHLSRISSTSPIGLWQFLDRDTNASIAEPGGQYTLAILPHHHTIDCKCHDTSCELPAGTSTDAAVYDIVYIDGAEIYPKRWHRGDIKGRLYDSPFENHYALHWFDSNRESAGTEISADFTSPSLLNFNFPLLKAKIRFARSRKEISINELNREEATLK